MIEASIAVIAVAFVILVIYLVIALRSLNKTLQQVNETLGATRQKLDDMTSESVKLLRHTNEISEDLQQKLGSIDSIFKAVSLVGDQAIETIGNLKSPKKEAEEEDFQSSSKSQSKISELVEWIAVGINLWLTLKKRR